MNYQKKLAIIPTEYGTENVTITEAVGTGLAYIEVQLLGIWHIVTTVNGHASVASIENANERNERIAQLFLNEIATLTDWSKDMQTIRMDMFTKYAYQKGGIDGRIEQARQDATNKFLAENRVKKLSDGQITQA